MARRSSLGPVEPTARPFVDIKEIAFDPATLTFRLALARGGSASLRVEAVDEEHIELAAGLDPAVAPPLPFAALRSMFVTDTNADTAEATWLSPGARAFATAPVMDFRRATGHRVPRRPPPAVAPQHERAGHGVPGFWGCTVARMSEATSGTAVVKVLEPAPHIAALMRTTTAPSKIDRTRSTPPRPSR